MKVLVHQTFVHASILEVPDDVSEELQIAETCRLADAVKFRLEDMEWQGSDYLRPDPDGTIALEDGTMMGEWFDV